MIGHRLRLDISSKSDRAIGDASVAKTGCTPAGGLAESAPASVSPAGSNVGRPFLEL
jgi:hypothetical protein